jgi:hypothetical protein
MVMITVLGTRVVAVGTFVMVMVLVVETVIVEVLQPGVVSMQEQSVLTKDAAAFWSEEKSGASLSSLRATMVGAHVVIVVATVLVSVTTMGVGELCG